MSDNCPWCGKENDATTCINGPESAKPKQGDLGVCYYCEQPHQFDQHGKRVRVTEGELRKILWNEPDTFAAMTTGFKEQKDYIEQIREMRRRADVWRKEHPGLAVLIRLKQDARTMVICTVTQAIENGFLITNRSGRMLIDYICQGLPPAKEPTLFMLTATLELKTQEEHNEPNRRT